MADGETPSFRAVTLAGLKSASIGVLVASIVSIPIVLLGLGVPGVDNSTIYSSILAPWTTFFALSSGLFFRKYYSPRLN